MITNLHLYDHHRMKWIDVDKEGKFVEEYEQPDLIFGHYTDRETDVRVAVIWYPLTDLYFTPTDWQGVQPDTLSELIEYDWIDERGEPAVMINGLPCQLVTT